MFSQFEEEQADSSTGQADLFMNCFLAILIVMFVFMLNQGVKAVASKVDQVLLERLMDSQQQTIKDAAERVDALAAGQKAARKKTLAEKQALLAAKTDAEAAAQEGKDRERILRGEIEDLEDVVTKARAAKSLRVDVSHDCTGSMAPAIGNTKSTMAALTRTLPNILTDVEIGLIGYRDRKLGKVPIQPIKKSTEDGGASIDQLNKMVNKLTAVGGTANTEQAIRASMSRLDAMSGSPRECLVIIGDIGTSEVSPNQPAVANRLIADVKAWCQRPGKNRRVLALYTGSPGSEDEAFFKRLGEVTKESMFSTKDSLMFELIIDAAFALQEESP